MRVRAVSGQAKGGPSAVTVTGGALCPQRHPTLPQLAPTALPRSCHSARVVDSPSHSLQTANQPTKQPHVPKYSVSGFSSHTLNRCNVLENLKKICKIKAQNKTSFLTQNNNDANLFLHSSQPGTWLDYCRNICIKPYTVISAYCQSNAIHGIGQIYNHLSVCLSVRSTYRCR